MEALYDSVLRTVALELAPEDVPVFEYRFPFIISSWHDGDTPIGFRGAQPGEWIYNEHVRVEGINSPELNTSAGKAARDYAAILAPPGTLVTLVSRRKEKYGRLLARIILPDQLDFGAAMISAGKAVAYNL